MTITPSKRAVVCLCLLGVCLSSAYVLIARQSVIRSQGIDPFGTDFLAFYGAARLVGSPNIYDSQANWAIQLATAGRFGEALTFSRLPCFALLLWPLGRLPFPAAKYLWVLFQLAAVGAAVYFWPGSRRLAAIVTCWSFPVMMCLANGTDTALVFLWLVLWRRLEPKNPFWSGVVLALCLAKFHLFLFLPLLLLRHRRWLVLQGAAIGVLVLVAISFLVAGWNWPVQYIHLLTTPGLSPSRMMMPNIHGLVMPALEWPIVGLTILLTSAAIFKFDYADGTAAALAGSLLLSYHAYAMDGVILIPAILLVLEKHTRPTGTFGRIAVYAAVLLMTPLPWIAIMMRGR